MSGTASGCRHTTFCHVCERVILLTTMGIKAVDSHMESERRDKKVNSIADYVSVGIIVEGNDWHTLCIRAN